MLKYLCETSISGTFMSDLGMLDRTKWWSLVECLSDSLFPTLLFLLFVNYLPTALQTPSFFFVYYLNIVGSPERVALDPIIKPGTTKGAATQKEIS